MRTTARTVILVLCVAALAALAMGGCVYYNTFYHAKSAYAEAEKMRSNRAPDSDPSATEAELLDRVVEKSGRVLRLYPESDWADDALLLLATALYRQGKYESAETRLTEFSTLYPGSDLTAEAGYLLAAVMLARDNPVSAEQTLTRLANADPPVDLSDDALMMIGRARHSRRRYDEAAQAYASVLERFPGSDLRAETRFLAAENFVAMGRLEDAAHHLAAVSAERGARQLAFEARIRLAEVYLDIGRTEDALEVLGDLERRTTDRDDLDRVLLLRGRTQEMMGEFDEAISTYEGIAASHARSKAAAEARYRVGLIRRDAFGDFELAVEAFREAKDEAPRTEVANEAGDAIRDVEELQSLLATIEQWLNAPEEADADTLSMSDTLAAADALAMPDTEAVVDAAVTADTLAGTIDTLAFAADSLSAVPPDESRFVSTLGDLAVAGEDSTFVTGPDATEMAFVEALAVADTLASAEPDTIPTPEAARAMFRAGEIYLFKMDNAESAVEYYGMVVEHFPETQLGPKAALAAAWARDARLSQPMLSAEAYRTVLDLYPGTEYADEAMKALGIEPDIPDTLTEYPPVEPPADEAVGGDEADPLDAAEGLETAPPDEPSDEPLDEGGGEEGP